MGMDELVRKAAARGKGWLNSEFFSENFPESKDKRIDNRVGYWFAANSKKKTCEFWLPILTPQDNPSVDDAPALLRCDNLVHVIREIYNTGGNSDSFSRLRTAFSANKLKNRYLSEEDFDTILPLFELLQDSAARERFYAGMKGRESKIQSLDLRFDAPFKLIKEGEEFNKGHVNSSAHFFYKGYVEALSGTLESMKESSSSIIEIIGKELRVLKSKLGDEEKQFVMISKSADHHVNSKIDYLQACRNFPRIATDVGLDCCIAQPDGKSKEATVLYALDKSVDVWSFTFGDGWPPYNAFALAIFVKARGHHFSKTDPEDYLVLEGFPASHRYYPVVGTLDGRARYLFTESYSFGHLGRLELTFPELVYIIGLKTAKQSGIPKLFVNADHSDKQKSVQDAVRTAAIECGLPRGEVWDRGSHGSFKLLKDASGSDFAKATLGGPEFSYTHFLEKRPLPSSLIRMIRKDSDWNGESVFDTWYNWNKFIMDTYDCWSPEAKALHPYSESVAKRGKNPQWNLGIGYCKGFEVDVEKECDRLGIK
jgi:hypothetical protein